MSVINRHYRSFIEHYKVKPFALRLMSLIDEHCIDIDALNYPIVIVNNKCLVKYNVNYEKCYGTSTFLSFSVNELTHVDNNAVLIMQKIKLCGDNMLYMLHPPIFYAKEPHTLSQSKSSMRRVRSYPDFNCKQPWSFTNEVEDDSNRIVRSSSNLAMRTE